MIKRQYNNLKKFINPLYHSIIGRFKRLHEKLKYTDVDKLAQTKYVRNPYTVFLDWLLDVFVRGLIVTIIVSVYFGWPGIIPFIARVFANGMIFWVVQESIKVVKESIRS